VEGTLSHRRRRVGGTRSGGVYTLTSLNKIKCPSHSFPPIKYFKPLNSSPYPNRTIAFPPHVQVSLYVLASSSRSQESGRSNKSPLDPFASRSFAHARRTTIVRGPSSLSLPQILPLHHLLPSPIQQSSDFFSRPVASVTSLSYCPVLCSHVRR
jgi:hypothetical protein